jgi:hypothetical protein
VYAAGESNFAVVVDGANRDVRCWGEAQSGQCGDDPDAGVIFHKTPVAPKW